MLSSADGKLFEHRDYALQLFLLLIQLGNRVGQVHDSKGGSMNDGWGSPDPPPAIINHFQTIIKAPELLVLSGRYGGPTKTTSELGWEKVDCLLDRGTRTPLYSYGLTASSPPCVGQKSPWERLPGLRLQNISGCPVLGHQPKPRITTLSYWLARNRAVRKTDAVGYRCRIALFQASGARLPDPAVSSRTRCSFGEDAAQHRQIHPAGTGDGRDDGDGRASALHGRQFRTDFLSSPARRA
jgi:hypothetical protein